MLILNSRRFSAISLLIISPPLFLCSFSKSYYSHESFHGSGNTTWHRSRDYLQNSRFHGIARVEALDSYLFSFDFPVCALLLEILRYFFHSIVQVISSGFNIDHLSVHPLECLNTIRF